MRPLLLLGLGTVLAAQEAPFEEVAPSPWIPAWEARVSREHTDLRPPKGDFWRTRGLLRLRWTWGEDGPLRLQLGTAHAAGTDRNAENLPWFDNTRSNGSWLDVAALRYQALGPAWGLRVEGGVMENPLLLSEAAWDPALRVTGGTIQIFWRGEGRVEEVGLRAVGGQVRLLAGGRVDLQGAQAVLRLATGPLTWTAFAGPLRFEARQEDAADFRRQNPAGPLGYEDPLFRFTALGLGVAASGRLPVELKAQRLTHRPSGQRGEEFQAWVGSPRRAWWPQAGYVRQRLDPLGALASVNGDQWWFHANADGQRYVLALNLPRRLRLEASVVDQLRRGAALPIRRSILALRKQF